MRIHSKNTAGKVYQLAENALVSLITNPHGSKLMHFSISTEQRLHETNRTLRCDFCRKQQFRRRSFIAIFQAFRVLKKT